MSKIKHQEKKKKIASSGRESLVCKQDVFFSFQYMTTNSKYNLEKCENKVKIELLERLEELSKHNIQYWFDKGKIIGFETIPFKNIRFSPKNMMISKDEKVIVARFGSGDYRVIFMKIGNCPILHIIGLDLKFNAYYHGS